jgi:hypothetical protein
MQHKPKLLGKGHGTNCDAILSNILPHFIALVEFLFLALFIIILCKDFTRAWLLIMMHIN